MRKRLRSLGVIYKTVEGGLSALLDAEIKALAEKHGMEFWAGGYSPITGEREQCFEQVGEAE